MTLLDIRGLKVAYGRLGTRVEVVHGVDLTIAPGETLGLVGESGSGKTTIGRAVLGLVAPSAGSIVAVGHQVTASMSRTEQRSLARDVQVVFQDPYTSLNPSLTIAETLGEPLLAQGVSRQVARERVSHLLRQVNLPADAGARYPREFSGGQRQRVAIARALALDPRLIVCDEPVSALDLSTQAIILELLVGIQERSGVGLLFISHDLTVVRHVSHRVAVMYRGDIVETGPTRKVTEDPEHDYTKRLLLASPVADPDAQALRRAAWQQARHGEAAA